jgi:carboxylesterase
VVFVAGALSPHPRKERSFLDFVHFERYAFKKAKVFGVPFFQKGNKKRLTTPDTKEPVLIAMNSTGERETPMSDKQQLPQLIAGASPQWYAGGDVGCLVLHGFMANPAEVGWLGAHLATVGYTVYVPRLTGHGIDHRHMRRMRWQDWYGTVLDAYHLLAQQCQTIHVVGHSMGGLLGLLLARAHPVDRLVVAAAPLLTVNPLMPYGRWLDMVMPYTEHPSEPDLNAAIIAEQHRRGEAVIGRTVYSRWSSRAVQELYEVMQVAIAHLPAVTVPTLLLYGEHDPTCPPAHMEYLAGQIASAHVEQYLVQAGGHIMFQDVGRAEAYQAVTAFLAGTR